MKYINRYNIVNSDYKYFILAFISFLIYWQTTSFGFVLDDMGIHLRDNPYFHKITFYNLLHIWQEPYKGMYIPITYMLWALIKMIGLFFSHDYQNPFNPFIYHLLNIILHSINGILVFKFLKEIIKKEWPSFMAALLFILHPLQVETVAWVSETRGLLSASFGLLSVLYYLRMRNLSSREKLQIRRERGYSWFFFLLALLSKPSAVVFPGLIFILDRYYFSRSWKDSICTVLTYIIFTIPIALITISSQSPQIIYPFWARPLIWLDTVNFYLVKLLFPVNLVPSYGRKLDSIFHPFWVRFTLLVPGIIGYYFWRMRRKSIILWISFLWILIGYLPVSGLVPFIFQDFSNVADRFFYISMVGVSLGFATALSFNHRRTTYFITSFLLLFLGFRSVLFQIPIWKNEIILWNYNNERVPGQALIYHNLGTAYLLKKKYYSAIRDLTMAINLDSSLTKSYHNRGNAFRYIGLLDLAEKDYNRAIQINPQYSLAYFNRAIIYQLKGQHKLAFQDCQKAVELEPLDSEAWHFLGILSAENSNYNNALVFFSKAIDINPVFSFAYYCRGKVYRKLGRYDLALKDFDMAIKLDPRKAANYYQRGLLYLLVSQPEESLKDFDQALALYSAYSAAKLFKVVALYQLGDVNSAQEILKASRKFILSSKDSVLFKQLQKIGLFDDSTYVIFRNSLGITEQ
jgi:tetratricopeptide (TPR) repeat protein